MLNKLANFNKEEDGFTLIELLVVILIIGILAAIAIPVFLNQQKAAVKASVQSDVRNTVSNVALFMTQNPNATIAQMNDATTGAKVVTTDTNTVVIAAAATPESGAYSVKGSNTAKLGATYAYTFDSSTGKYTTTP